MTESDKKYLIDFIKVDDSFYAKYKRNSTLKLALRNAREQSGRNLETGVYEKSEIKENWFEQDLILARQFSSILLYSIVLEQIGSIFQLTEGSQFKGIKNAIFSFSNVKDKTIMEEIYSLRNSFAHKFGLCTENNRISKSKFILSIDEKDDLLKLPKTKWSGDYSDKSEDTSTTINLIKFQDFTEKIYQKIQEYLNLNRLELLISIEELNSRYTVI